jgi:glycerol-3-phosphate cytidylyltransferase
MKTGIIAGAFDVIHPGYVMAFYQARMHCNRLIVCLHADPTVEHPEKIPPILSVSERMMILSAFRQVDEVIVYRTEAEFGKILEQCKPDVRFLGQDYEIGIDKISNSELNIPIVFLDRSHGWSATKFKKMIQNQMSSLAEKRKAQL